MSDQPGSSVVSVPTGRLTYYDRRTQLALVIIAPVDALLIIGLTIGGPTHDTLLKVVLFMLTLIAYELIVEEIISVRRVDIDSSGVTFRYLMHKERGSWADLGPSQSPVTHGMWEIVRVKKSGARRGHLVTLAQAQAILRSDCRPHWDFRPGVAESLGLVKPMS
jgi:hypothetical protein